MNNNKGEYKMKIADKLIGKKVIVRANVAGVHCGVVEMYEPETQTIMLSSVRRLWRVYTRDTTGSISDVAANGLKEDAKHSIGALLPSVTILNPPGLEIAECTDQAFDSVLAYGGN